VRKGLEIIEAAQKQDRIAVVTELCEYASYLDRADLVKLKVPIAERCIEVLAGGSPNQFGRPMACCRTALLLPEDDPRRLALLTECLQLSGRKGAYPAADTDKARKFATMLYVDARWYKAHSLARKHHPDEALREFRSILEYLKTNPTMTPEEKATKFANATLGATLVIMDDKARITEVTAMLDTLNDLPPSLHQFCFWRDMIRSHTMRTAGRFAECQTYLESLMLRNPAAFDVARIRREMGHVKVAQGQLDGGIADFKESLTIFAKVKDSSTIGSFENELDDTRRHLAGVEARKQSVVRIAK